MSYTIILGDEAFSSWSLRGWLLLEKFGLPYTKKMAGLYSGTFAEDLAPYAPARQVPVLVTEDGEFVGDTLAICETLADRHPEAGHWPQDPKARARARWLVAEMHSSFGALRSACPMQVLHQLQGFEVTEAVQADLDRIDAIFAAARAAFPAEGPWVFGRYTAVDAFYAPVAARIAGYGLKVSPALQAYVDAHLADPAFRAWREAGLKRSYDPQPYAMDLPKGPWPA